MDSILRLAWDDFEAFKRVHLFAPAGTSPLTLLSDSKLWDYSQLWNPLEFEWKSGITPFADLSTIRLAWVCYFTMVMGLKFFMKDREPIKLKWFTAFHSLSLCIGSLGMFLAGLFGAIEIYQNGGIGDVFLFKTMEVPRKGMMYYSLYIYYLSKFPELIDTAILVLKKKNVIFLHWYHHAIVILMVWTWMECKAGFAVFGLLFNTAVHVFMYWYYFASVLGFNVWYKKYITSMQIVQFICSFLISGVFFKYALEREFENWYYIYFTTAVNFSFLLLFINFYINNYRTNRPPKSGDRKSKLKEE